MIKLLYATATDRGQVRPANQDSVFAGLISSERARTPVHLLAIADGMGGYQAGEVASQMAIYNLKTYLENQRPGWPEPENAGAWMELLQAAMRFANQKILMEASTNHQYSGMGTTMTAAIIVEDRIYVGHVGDSRLYHMGSGLLHQVTQDHSLVGELVRMGELTSDQAMTHPQRNIVTRALGTEWDVVIDCFSLELSAGDSLLLCTDGLTSMIRFQELAERLALPTIPERVASSLIEEANARGGYDNISVIVCQVRSGEVGGGAV